jgi:hypothetical protein
MHDFTINFEDNTIVADKDTSIRLNVVGVVMNRSWYSTENFYFTVLTNSVRRRYFIPAGNYDVYSFMEKLQAVLTSWTITYNIQENKYHFTAPESSQIIFDEGYEHMVGFPFAGYSMSGTNIVSDIPVVMSKEQAVLIHCSLIKRRMAAIDNLSSEHFVESHVICKIPLSGYGYFDDMVYNESSENHFSYHISTTKVQSMKIYVTDQDGNPLPLTRDWSITFKFNYINNVQQEEELKCMHEIRDLIKYFILSNDKGMATEHKRV